MTTSTLLQKIRDANKSYLGGVPRYLGALDPPCIVVGCIDPRLNGLLEPALGLTKNSAFVIRTAGNRIGERNTDVLRSIAVAVYTMGCSEIFIVGHTDCAMARFSAADVIERVRNMGVSRSAFGDDDLRTWFGAISDIRDNTLQGAAYLRRSGILHEGVRIHCLLMDTDSGTVEVVLDGSSARPERAAAASGRSSDRAGAAAEQPAVASIPRSKLEIPAIPESEKTPGVEPLRYGKIPDGREEKPDEQEPQSMLDAALLLKKFFVEGRNNPDLRRAVSDLRTQIRRDPNPARVLAVLEKIVLDNERQYPKIAGSLKFIKAARDPRSQSGAHLTELLRRILD